MNICLVLINSIRKKLAYRPKQKIICRILMAARAPKTRVKILYESMVSWEQCSQYLKDLSSRDLLKYDPFNSVYMVTGKGLKFLELYEKLKDEIESNAK